MFLLNMQPSVLYTAGSRASPPDYFNNTPYLDPEGTLKMLTRKLRVCVLPHTSSSFFNFSHKKGSQVQVKIKSELLDGKFITSPTSKVPYFFSREQLHPTHSLDLREFCIFFPLFGKKNTKRFFFFQEKFASHSLEKNQISTKKRSKKRYFTLFFGTFRIFSNTYGNLWPVPVDENLLGGVSSLQTFPGQKNVFFQEVGKKICTIE